MTTARRKRREAGRRASPSPSDGDFFRLVDRTSDLVLIVQRNRIAYANPAFCAALRYASSELVGMPALQLAAEGERAAVAERIASALSTGRPNEPVERRLVRKDGTLVLIEGASFPSEFGGQPAVVLMGRDLTARRESEEGLRALFHAAPLVIMTADLERRLLFWHDNPWRPVLHWPDPREHCPRPPYTVAGRDLLEQLCDRVEASGRAEEMTVTTRTFDEREMRLQATAAPLRDPSGRIERFVITLNDLTEAWMAEERARRAESMAAVGALVAGTAHEVRNPLFGMGATLDAMQARFGNVPGQGPFLAALRQDLASLNALMQDLLDYGRPPALDLRPERLAPVISATARACAPTAARAGVVIEDADAGAMVEVLMDPPRLGQAFRNIVENALQHSPPGSRVRIESEPAASPTGAVEVRVVDAGPGFLESDLAHVFEPFYTRRPGGSGLGLAIVQRIVEQHGGTVWAGNRLGGGGVVSVRLPLA